MISRLALVVAMVVVPAPDVPLDVAYIAGTVVTTDDEPVVVRRAVVSLWGGAHPLGHHTVADDDGRFLLGPVPAGRYELSASRPSFVPVAYGAAAPGLPGTPVVLEAGDQLADVVVRLAPGAVVTGRITSDSGQPLEGIQVSVQRADVSLQPSHRSLTNDQGEYRVFGLRAGAYLVSAHPPVTRSPSVTLRSDAEVDALLAALRRRAMPGAPPTIQDVGQQTSDFVPVYFPGRFDPDEAATVVLDAGEERAGVDIAILLMPVASVSGRVTPEHAGTGYLDISLSRLVQGRLRPPMSARTSPDGRFSFSSVPPGRYRLAARRLDASPLREADVGACASATQDVVVTGADISGLHLGMNPCRTLPGRITFDGINSATPADISGIRVRLEPLPDSGAGNTFLGRPVLSSRDGRFVLGSAGELTPGRYVARVEVPTTGPLREWSVRSAMVNNEDVLDRPLDIEGLPQGAEMVVTLTDVRSSLSGRLVTSAGGAASSYTVLVFPVQRDWWQPPFRRVRSARAAGDGSYRFDDLPPGDYHLAAITDVTADSWLDAAFLDGLVDKTVRITVGPGQALQQDFRIEGRTAPSR